ncbi:HECT domain-containing protein [Plasmodiophora brassicae]
MAAAVPLILVLGYLLTASLHAIDARGTCSDVSTWTVDEIDGYLTALPANAVAKCFAIALLGSIVVGRRDAVQCITRHHRFGASRVVLTRIAWYAYVLVRRNGSQDTWRILHQDLLPALQMVCPLSQPQILARFVRHYNDNPLPDSALSIVLDRAPDLQADAQQCSPNPSTSCQLVRQSCIRLPPNDATPEDGSRAQTQTVASAPCTSRSQQAALHPTAAISQRRRARGNSDEEEQRPARRPCTRRPPLQPLFGVPPAPMNTASNPNAVRPPRVPPPAHTAHVAIRRVVRVGAAAATAERERSWGTQQVTYIRPWTYLIKDGTQQEQGQEFLASVAAMIDAGNDRVRGRLFVKSESSRAIDESGLSAALIQFAAAVLAGRLGRAGQLLYSESNDRAFVPRSPTSESDDERRDLMLLGALIGIVDNHRRMGPKCIMALPMPLPSVAFRALLTADPITVTGNEASETALASIYEQYCGDQNPIQCNRDRQFDVDDLFLPVPGVDYNSTNEYLRGLVGLLLASPAFEMVRRGYLETARRPLRDRTSYQAMRVAVIADPHVTPAKFARTMRIHLQNMAGIRSWERHVIDVATNIAQVIRSMTGDELADLVEAATGTRCLPLTMDTDSMITVSVLPCDGIAFHTCFRIVKIPIALTRSAACLRSHLLGAVKDFIGGGITSRSHNAA